MAGAMALMGGLVARRVAVWRTLTAVVVVVIGHAVDEVVSDASSWERDDVVAGAEAPTSLLDASLWPVLWCSWAALQHDEGRRPPLTAA